MPLLTTCIGAYPKPEFVKLPDWFTVEAGPDTADPTRFWVDAMKAMGPDAADIINKGVGEAISDQVTAGIDIPTDGEIIRENYIHYHCRHLNGFDFDGLTNKEVRGGTYAADLPTIRNTVSIDQPFLYKEWQAAQAHTDKPVKMTIPGPMTISDTNVDTFYNDPAKLGADIAVALNKDVLRLAEAGCKNIQIDEPLFARKPQQALDYGFENLERAFHNCPADVVRTVHMCCGYPDRLDHPNYPKADQNAYLHIADAVEQSSINAVSVEDAHRHNDLSLLEHFKSTTVIFGVVAIAKSRIEPVEEIRSRLQQALAHIDSTRLIAAPDCGLGLLDRNTAVAKLTNLSAAAKSV
ncbi:5-methyltetrahydropteroyltriglutamate--homocysteine methyltransferase [Chromatiales bacterium (ex Bugula neritina AB1)]|nr:5-methyltetrahydropteroyltriglutamate--homocysteine methyltransferase [Chromatiales bacterium (ex Bugula neritina AB1)]